MKDIHIREHTNKNGQKSYEYRFEIAAVNGKRKWHTKSGFKTKTEARRVGMAALQRYENTGRLTVQSDVSFSDFLDIWMESDCKVDLKPTTILNYQKRIENHIKPALGKYCLKAIRREDLQAFVIDMFDRGYSSNTLSSIIGILSKCMNYAVDHNYLQHSPAIRLKIPKNRNPKTPTRSEERVFIPADVMKRIYDRFPETEPSHIPLRLGYECGLRIGEAFALIWEDIDIQNKTITVNRQVQWHQDKTRTTVEKVASNGSSASGNGYWYFANPKYNSVRTIEISDSLVELLLRERERQLAMEKYYGEFYTHYYTQYPISATGSQYQNTVAVNPISEENTGNPINFVCVRDNGTYITSRTMQHTSHVIRKGIFEKFAFHGLRHTHATILYESGLSDKYVSVRLGHKDTRVTKAVYIHLTDTIRERGRKMVNQIFNDIG